MLKIKKQYLSVNVNNLNLKFIFLRYLSLFFGKQIVFFEKYELNFIPKTFLFFRFPRKQFLFQLYYLPLNFNINLSMGAFIKWNFKRAKFYRRQLKSITPFILLLWQHFDEFLRENISLVINNYNFFIYTILNRYFDVVNYLPHQIIFLKSFINILYKPKRIKKRVYKLIQHI